MEPTWSDILGTIPQVVDAFRAGILPGVAAAVALALAVLNVGPLRRRLASSSLDWLGPLLTLVLMVAGGVVGAFVAGAGVGDAIVAGIGVLATGGGPVMVQLVRDIRD